MKHRSLAKIFSIVASLLALFSPCTVSSQEEPPAPSAPEVQAENAAPVEKEKKVIPLQKKDILPVISVHKTASGLRYEVRRIGNGAEAIKDKPVTVHYTGWLDNNGKRGRKFDSSKDRGTPFLFYLGREQVIPGWEEGILGMKLGEIRTLYIPAKLAYGSEGTGAVIPPNADLIFDVELVDVY